MRVTTDVGYESEAAFNRAGRRGDPVGYTSGAPGSRASAPPHQMPSLLVYSITDDYLARNARPTPALRRIGDWTVSRVAGRHKPRSRIGLRGREKRSAAVGNRGRGSLRWWVGASAGGFASGAATRDRQPPGEGRRRTRLSGVGALPAHYPLVEHCRSAGDRYAVRRQSVMEALQGVLQLAEAVG
jgi:hypothetical protein